MGRGQDDPGADPIRPGRDIGGTRVVRWVVVYILLAVAVGAALGLQAQQTRTRFLDDHLIEARATWDAVTHVYRLVSASIVAESVDRPPVWTLMRRAQAEDPAERDRARQALYRRMGPVYARLKARGLRQLHFHLPDATSFLRMHKPERYGDSLAEVRPTVVRANREQRPVSAFETGRIYHGFRFVFPLGTDAPEAETGALPLGTVEASVGFDALKAEMEVLRPETRVQFVLSASAVRDHLFADRTGLYSPVPFNPDWVTEASPPEVASLAPVRAVFGNAGDPLTEALARRDDLTGPMTEGRAFVVAQRLGDGVPRAVAFLPVHNIMGSVAAYVVAVAPAPDLDRLDRQAIIEGLILLGLLGLLVVLFALAQSGRRRARAQRQRLLAVADAMAEGLYVLDRDGRISFVNAAAERLLGWRRAALVGQRPDARFARGGPADDPDGVAVRIAPGPEPAPRPEAGGPGSAEMTDPAGATPPAGEGEPGPGPVEGPVDIPFTRADGSTFLAQVTRAPLQSVRDPQGVAVLTFSDVTAIRAAQERLRKQNALLSTQREAMPEGLVVVDPRGRVDSWNRRLLELWAIAPGELEGADRTALRALLARRLATPLTAGGRALLDLMGQPATTRGPVGPGLEVSLDDGTIVEVLSRPLVGPDAQTFGEVWFTRDITAFRRAERALAERSQALQQANADLRSSREDLRRRTTDLARLAESLDIARGEAEVREAEAASALTRLRETQAHLVRAEKMAAVGRLVAAVAHQINTPIGTALTAVTHLSDELTRLREDVGAGRTSRRRFDAFATAADNGAGVIHASLRRAADLVHSFKQVSVAPREEERAMADLAVVVARAIEAVQDRVPDHPARMTVDVPDAISLDSYPGALEQALDMLIENALVHGLPAGRAGTVTVSVSYHTVSEVVLQVRDDGVGMAADTMRRAFDPFFTTLGGRAHTGLGLHIVFSLVTEVLGGRISVDSTEGAGTVFVLELPCVAP